jgi:hypothetical protein
MINWIKSFFGAGKVRIQFTDTKTNEVHVVRMSYVGAFDEDDAIDELRHMLYTRHNIIVKNAQVLGFV